MREMEFLRKYYNMESKITLKDLLSITHCGFDVYIINKETSEFFYAYFDREDIEGEDTVEDRILNAKVIDFNADMIYVYIEDYNI